MTLTEGAALSPIERLEELRRAALAQLEGADDTPALDQWHATQLGRRSPLSELMSGLGRLPKEDRASVGQAANAVKQALEAAYAARQATVRARELGQTLERERIDVSLPGRKPSVGALHPITQTIVEAVEVLRGMGFQVTQTPEVETDYFNFESLNIPAWHPARDMQDTIYVNPPSTLLRTQTTAYQARVMTTQPPPVRIVNVGRCYRSEAVDATHEWMFQQIDGLAVDEGITMAELRGHPDRLCPAVLHAVGKPEPVVSCAPAFAATTSRSSSRASISPSSATAARAIRAARSATARAGSKSSAPAWCTRACSRTPATTRIATPASPGAWASSG